MTTLTAHCARGSGQPQTHTGHLWPSPGGTFCPNQRVWLLFKQPLQCVLPHITQQVSRWVGWVFFRQEKAAVEHTEGGQCPLPAHSAHTRLVTPLLALRWQLAWLPSRAVCNNTCKKTRKTLVKAGGLQPLSARGGQRGSWPGGCEEWGCSVSVRCLPRQGRPQGRSLCCGLVTSLSGVCSGQGNAPRSLCIPCGGAQSCRPASPGNLRQDELLQPVLETPTGSSLPALL